MIPVAVLEGNCAFRYALHKNHEYITVEHLLIALLQNYEVALILHHHQVNIRELHQQLVENIARHTPVLRPNDPAERANYTIHRRTRPTLGMDSVLQRARFLSECAGRTEISAAHALIAIYGEHESHAVYLLKEQGLERAMIADFIKQQSKQQSKQQCKQQSRNSARGLASNSTQPAAPMGVIGHH